MVFENSDIRKELFPDSSILVMNDPSKSYKFTLSDDEIHNDIIERMYGPFRSTSEYYYPTPVNLPRIVARTEDSNMQKQQEIVKLKRLIAEIQAKKEKMATAESSKPLLPSESSSPKDIKPMAPLPKVVNQPEVTEKVIDKAVEKPTEKASDKPPVPIVIIDSDEDMVVESDEDMVAESDGDKSRESEEPMSMSTSDSPNTFYTAHESFMQTESPEVEALGITFNKAEHQVKRLIIEKKNISELSKEMKLKLLGIKARLSLGQRKELRNKSQETPSPLLGEKRVQYDSDEMMHPQRSNRRRFEYAQQQDVMNYSYNPTVSSSFYQQLPPQPMHNFIAPPMNYLPHHHLQSTPPPPPPPPTELPPFTPPPPPPPPPLASPPSTATFTNRYPVQPSTATLQPRRTNSLSATSSLYKPNVPKSRAVKSMVDETDIVPMGNLNQIKSTLKELEQFISVRIFNDHSVHPIIEGRSLPRPLRLFTVDKYTMPMNMVVLDENKEAHVWKYPSSKFKLPAGLPVETEIDETWYESPFFVMLYRKALSQPSSSTIQSAIDTIIQSIKPHDDLSSVKIGSVYFVSLEDTLNVARIYYHQNPKNEFFAALKLELSFYVHGNTSQFHDDYKESVAQLPLSVDVEWQRIRAEVTFSNQLPLILNLLHRISLEHTSFDSKESWTNSSMTTEVLIRLLRLNGLEQVLRLMTNKEIDIDTEKLEIFDMDDAPGLYLQEQDKYCIWMLILYYYVNKSIPDFVCSTWMNTLVKDGTPTKHMSIFMIDWTLSQLTERPLDRSTLFGATNILLSMLRHFGNKACNDIRRKSLLVGTWRTLSSFLANTPCYKVAGTLMLMRNASVVVKQIPEIQEIITDLEIKAERPIETIIEQIYQSKEAMSLSNIHSLCFHIAMSYYEKYPVTNLNLLVMAKILSYPLLEKNTKLKQMNLLTKILKDTNHEAIIIAVDSIRQHYLATMGIDFALGNTQSDQQNNQRKIPFAWMNLLLLTSISKFLYPKESIIRGSLDNNIKLIFEQAMNEIESGDGKVAIFKYANLVTTQKVAG